MGQAYTPWFQRDNLPKSKAWPVQNQKMCVVTANTRLTTTACSHSRPFWRWRCCLFPRSLSFSIKPSFRGIVYTIEH